eukprot:987984-Amphidinium_carterae.1
MVEARFIPTACWCDGVPVSWDKEESVQIFMWSLPGLGGEWQKLRGPRTVVSKRCVGAGTMEHFHE